MNSKKIIFLLVVCTILTTKSIAQSIDSANTTLTSIHNKKFYIGFGIGYNSSAGIGSFSNHVENRDSSYSDHRIVGSFGKGVDVSISFGRKVNRNLGFEMELGYLLGGENKESNQFYVTKYPIHSIDKQEIYYKANTFRVNPKIVFEVPYKKNAFYGKIGYLVGFGKAISKASETWYLDNGGKGSGTYAWEYKGGVVSGSTMAIGFRFEVDKNASFFIEATGNNLHRTFKKKSMTEAVDNGTSTLASRNVYDKEMVFVNNASFPAHPDLTQPREWPAYRSNYSSAGIRIGFIAHF